MSAIGGAAFGRAVLIALAMGALAAPASAAGGSVVPTLEAELLHPGGSGADQFGLRVAVDGDTAVVGVFADNSFAGTAHVFVRSGGGWVHQQELRHPQPASGDHFGIAVDIEGDTIVVGAPADDDALGDNDGSAQVYVRNGSAWDHRAELRHPDPLRNGMSFGQSVAIHASTILVGAPGDFFRRAGIPNGCGCFSRAGSAHFFVNEVHGGTLTDTDPAASDEFGRAVALDASGAVVGAPLDDVGGAADAGAAHLYSAGFGLQSILTAPDRATGDQFGDAVAISNGTVMVGARDDDRPTGFDAGSVHVYGGGVHKAVLIHPNGGTGDRFGASVALDGDMAVVGAPFDTTGPGTSDIRAGSAHVFLRAGESWAFGTELRHPDQDFNRSDDGFGTGVAIDGTTAVIGVPRDNNVKGSDAGSAYVFGLRPIPTASLSDAGGAEDAGVIQVSVALDREASLAAHLDYEVLAGSAGADDAALGSGGIDIPTGARSAVIEVAVTDDNVFERDETLTVRLTGGTEVLIGDGDATLTIEEDDPPPTVDVADVQTAEGDPAVLGVSLSAPAGVDVTVSFETADGTANAPDDYAAVSGGELTVPAGGQAGEITVATEEDGTDERDEAFTVRLTGAVNGTVGDGEATATILDDDLPPCDPVQTVLKLLGFAEECEGLMGDAQ